jgi:hypothetical protein
MTNDLLTYGENICAFPHILGSLASYMTLHPIPSEFPYTWGNYFFYQCSSGHLQYSTVVYVFLSFYVLQGRVQKLTHFWEIPTAKTRAKTFNPCKYLLAILTRGGSIWVLFFPFLDYQEKKVVVNCKLKRQNLKCTDFKVPCFGKVQKTPCK